MINGVEVKKVQEFYFLRTVIREDLFLTGHIFHLVGMAHQRLYFLSKLWRTSFSEQVLLSLFKAVIESVLTYNISVARAVHDP